MTKQKDKASELNDFYLQLIEYTGLLERLLNKKRLTNKQQDRVAELFETICLQIGRNGSLIVELTGIERIAVGDKECDMWTLATRLIPDKLTLNALEYCIPATKRAIGQLQEDIQRGVRDKQGKLIVQPPVYKAELPINLFDKMQFHPEVVKASRSLFESRHYAQAIFEAFKAVENFVQDKSGLTLYGTNLMERVFNEENPILKVPEASHYYKEVQKGFKHLFIGASQGIRNPKAHKEIVQKDPYITLEYLGFFSFLLKRIDYWDLGVS